MLGILILFLFAYIVYLVFNSGKSVGTSLPSAENTSRSQRLPEKVDYPSHFGWLLMAVVLAFNVFLYSQHNLLHLGIGVGLFNAVVVGTIGYALWRRETSPKTIVAAVAVMSVVAGLAIGLRANGFVQTVNFVVTFFALWFLVLLHALRTYQWQGVLLGKYALELIPRSIGQIGALLADSQRSELKHKLTPISILKTVGLTLIVSIFFINVLSSADPIFEQMIERIKDELLGRTVFSLMGAALFVVMLTMAVRPRSDEKVELRFFSFRDVIAPLVAVVTLFGLFLFVQARYLFGTHADLGEFGFTYAEYVRKGFVELLVAAFFGSAVAYLATVKQRVLTVASQVKQLQVLTTVLLVELGFVLISALQRDLLYVSVYGLTRVRIIGGIFVFWIAGVLLLLLAFALYRALRERHLLAGVLGLSFLVVLGLNGLNVDRMIALAPAPQGGQKDYYYINNLSEDAFEGWKASVPAATEVVARLTAKPQLNDTEKSELANTKLALISLQDKRRMLDKKYADEATLIKVDDNLRDLRAFQSSNLSQWRAYHGMQRERDLFYTQVDALIERIREYQIQHNRSLYEDERRWLRDNDQPFGETEVYYAPEDLDDVLRTR